jgi:hypothetical protein
LFRLLGLEVTLDFQLTELADERARLTGQAIGFALKGTNTFGNALTLAIGCRRRLRQQRWRRQQR